MIYWVPSALCLVSNLKALGKVDISCLKKVLFAGEAMPAKQFNQWREHLPNTFFANLYGPTETTDICNYYVVQRKIDNNDQMPEIPRHQLRDDQWEKINRSVNPEEEEQARFTLFVIHTVIR